MDAIMGSYDAHTTMSRQALNSERVRGEMLDLLLDHVGLWKALRARAEQV